MHELPLRSLLRSVLEVVNTLSGSKKRATAGPFLCAVLSVFWTLGCQSPAPVAREPQAGATRRPEPPKSTPSPRALATRSSLAPASPTPPAEPTPSPSVKPESISASEIADPVSRLALQPPGPAKPAGSRDSQLEALMQQAKQTRMAAHWRKAGERALKVHHYSTAVSAFRQEAAIYRSKGILQAALAQEARAEQYSTEFGFYLSGRSSSGARLQRLEPEAGCLVGAFIDRDDKVRSFMMGSQTHGDIDEFNELTGKKHASFFMYRAYGEPFPRQWAEYLKEREAIIHLAWEPRELSKVKDDAYLERFVDDMVALDHPVMLRFASEMNGEWTPYHGNPQRYKEAFRMVYRATRRAPKVALLWCPNTIPRQNIEEYYPGDDLVDWVGVNFYSVPFLDNDRSRPGELIHPTDHLRYVYDLYASRKPIAIGEWAASHQSSATTKPMVEFAKTKISQLYGSLPTRFPKVKMVNWYSSNNLRHASPSRQLNNYQVTEPQELLEHYSSAVSSPYFLGAGQSQSAVGLGFRPVFGRVSAESRSELRIALKTYVQRPKVYIRLNGKMKLATDEPLDWRLSGRNWKVGKNTVEVLVYDRDNRFITRETLVLHRS